jgi:hypothetical protein
LSKERRADNIGESCGAKDVKRAAHSDNTNGGGRSSPNTAMKMHSSAMASLVKAVIGMRVRSGGKSWDDAVMKAGKGYPRRELENVSRRHKRKKVAFAPCLDKRSVCTGGPITY